MKLFFPPDQNYDCVMCARSCHQGWRIHVDPHTEEPIKNSPVALRIIQEQGYEKLVVIDPLDNSRVLTRKPDGSCVFLDQKLCSLHAELGAEAKPVGCRQFPFLFTLTPDGIYLGTSYWCTAAQQNLGRPVEVHEADLRELLKLFSPPGWEGSLKLCAISQAELDWPTYLRVEELIREHGYPTALLALAELAGFEAPPGPVPAEVFEVAFGRARPERLTQDELLAESSKFFLASLIGSIECPPDQARGLTEELMQDRPFRLEKRGFEGQFSSWLSRPLPPLFTEQMERYRAALLHRKFLLRGRPLLENVVALYLLEPLMRFYTRDGTLESIYGAFDTLELELYTHTTSACLDSVLAACAQAYAEILRASVL